MLKAFSSFIVVETGSKMAQSDLGIILFHRKETLDGGTKLFEMILLQIKADERRCTEVHQARITQIWSKMGQKKPKSYMRALAAVSTFFISITRVMGPTPPGTGVM